MAQLDDRLRTRFEWGLMVDVQPPDLETRIAILKNKAVQLGFLLSDDIAAYIASKITANVRQMEGTVKKIKAFKDLDGMEVDKAAVDRAIQDMSKYSEFVITPENIIAEICRYFRIDETQIKGHVPHPPHDQPLPQRHRKPLRRPGPRHSHQLYLQSRKKDEVRPRLRRNGQGHHHQYQLHQMTPVKNRLAYNTGVSTFSTRFSTI